MGSKEKSMTKEQILNKLFHTAYLERMGSIGFCKSAWRSFRLTRYARRNGIAITVPELMETVNRAVMAADETMG